jgi:hypothetical protein
VHPGRTGFLGLLIAAALCGAPIAWAADACQPIRFEPGHNSTTLLGSAPANDVVCYVMTTGRGQTATLKVVSGDNTIFSIDGMVDAQDSYSFKTERKTYRIQVGQLMRADAPEAFAIDVSVK